VRSGQLRPAILEQPKRGGDWGMQYKFGGPISSGLRSARLALRARGSGGRKG